MDVKVGSCLRDCRVRTDLGQLPGLLGEPFLQEHSRFRIYRYTEEERETVDQLLRAGDVPDADRTGGFGAWYRETPGTRLAWGDIHGKTTGSTGFAIRCAYVPDPRRWDLRLVRNRPVTVAIRKLAPTRSATEISWEDWWRGWNLIARLDIWELVDHWELFLDGPLWDKGELAIQHGLAEEYMQDLLAKTLEIYSRFLPSFTEVGAKYDLRNAHNVFAIERLIPRISWANIFGPSYVEKYGREFLLAAPGFRTKELEDGSILYQVTRHFLLTAEDVDRGPPPEEVEGYFRRHPEVRRIVYRPVLLRDFLPRQRRSAGRANPSRRTTTDLIRWAEDAVSVFGDRFGIVLDYSPESLRKMDDAISTYFEKGEEPLPTTALPLGAYVGEVVRVNLGGDWHIAESVLESSIVISGPGGGQELYPFRRVVKRFVEGTSASLEVWYEAAVRSSRN